MSQVSKALFTIAVTLISRALVLADRLAGRLRDERPPSGLRVSRDAIRSGSRTLDAVFVTPGTAPAAALLICHGIGEVVEHWLPAQQLLAAHGIASLVFDYSGYGRSGGRIDWRACEEDALAAWTHLRSLAPDLPVSLLGYSMGSGIACALLDRAAEGAVEGRVAPACLILGSAFTSFRDAACALGLPRPLSGVLPDIWRVRERLAASPVPVLILHGERDRALPVAMARALLGASPPATELIVVPAGAHNEAFHRPGLSYWNHVIRRLVPDGCRPVQGEPAGLAQGAAAAGWRRMPAGEPGAR